MPAIEEGQAKIKEQEAFEILKINSKEFLIDNDFSNINCEVYLITINGNAITDIVFYINSNKTIHSIN